MRTKLGYLKAYAKIVNGWNYLIIFTKNLIFDVWLSSIYISGHYADSLDSNYRFRSHFCNSYIDPRARGWNQNDFSINVFFSRIVLGSIAEKQEFVLELFKIICHSEFFRKRFFEGYFKLLVSCCINEIALPIFLMRI